MCCSAGLCHHYEALRNTSGELLLVCRDCGYQVNYTQQQEAAYWQQFHAEQQTAHASA